mgnify:FL=1
MKYKANYLISKDVQGVIIKAELTISAFDDANNQKDSVYELNEHEIELIKTDPANIKQIIEPKIADGMIALFAERKTIEDHTATLLAQYTPDPNAVQTAINEIAKSEPAPTIDLINPIKIDVIVEPPITPPII